MENVLIRHPLREINFSLKPKEEQNYYISEDLTVQNYIRAHSTIWEMKIGLEKERGEAMLAHLELDQLIKAREELEDIYEFYKPQLDFTNPNLNSELDIRLQVELRDYCKETIRLQNKLVRFYDNLGSLQIVNDDIVDKHFAGVESAELLNLKVLDDILAQQTHPHIDLVSLDKDLQEFLDIVSDVYKLLDDYIEEYNLLYAAYLHELDKAVELVQMTRPLNSIWEK